MSWDTAGGGGGGERNDGAADTAVDNFAGGNDGDANGFGGGDAEGGGGGGGGFSGDCFNCGQPGFVFSHFRRSMLIPSQTQQAGLHRASETSTLLQLW